MAGLAQSEMYRLDTTLGATFLGFAWTCAMYGITGLQTWIYFGHNFKDEKLMRSAVSLLWILDTLHMIFLTMTMYHYVVTEFGNLSKIEKPTWSLAAMVIVSLVSNTVVRAIFGIRILRIGKGAWLGLVLFVNALSLFVLGVGIYFVVKGLAVNTLFDVHKFSWSFWAGISADLLVDGIITASQCLLLLRMRTGVRSSDSVISLLIKYTINTGLLTSLCALIALITFTALPGEFVYFAFYFVYSKLYVNSLLATLNARAGAISQRAARMRTLTDIEFKSREIGQDFSHSPQLTTIIDLGTRNGGEDESPDSDGQV